MLKHRTMVAMFALAAVAGSVLPAQDDAEARAVRVVEKLGGTLTRDPKAKGNPVVGVNLSAKKLTDADINTRVTDPAVAELQKALPKCKIQR